MPNKSLLQLSVRASQDPIINDGAVAGEAHSLKGISGLFLMEG